MANERDFPVPPIALQQLSSLIYKRSGSSYDTLLKDFFERYPTFTPKSSRVQVSLTENVVKVFKNVDREHGPDAREHDIIRSLLEFVQSDSENLLLERLDRLDISIPEMIAALNNVRQFWLVQYRRDKEEDNPRDPEWELRLAVDSIERWSTNGETDEVVNKMQPGEPAIIWRTVDKRKPSHDKRSRGGIVGWGNIVSVQQEEKKLQLKVKHLQIADPIERDGITDQIDPEDTFWPGQVSLRRLTEREREVFDSAISEIDDKWAEPHNSATTPEVEITATLFSDRVSEGDTDKLSIDDEARAFARLIASESTHTPLSIGIFGPWGSGKSFFLYRISEFLRPFRNQNIDGYHRKIVEIEFNAWHYMETNIWASLVDVIFKKLDEEVNKSTDSEMSLVDQLATSQTLQLEAIEQLALRAEDVIACNQGLSTARVASEEYAVDGIAFWQALSLRLADHKKFRETMNALDLDVDSSETEKLTQVLLDLESASSLTKILAKSAGTKEIWVVATALLLVAVSLVYLDFVEFLQAALIPVTGWIMALGGMSTRLKLLFTEANKIVEDAKMITTEENQKELDRRRNKEEIALAALEDAKVAIQIAHTRYSESHPGTAIGSLVSRRAVSDDYTKYLSVIATIRNDFEQLSALMTNDQAERANLVEFREKLRARLNTVRDRYSSCLDQYGIQDDFDVVTAIEELEVNLEEDSLGDKPFTRIVLKVDDLDRCPTGKVKDVLQAVHLFLNFPLFVVLVCVDERWMSSSLVEEFGDLVNGSAGVTTSDYLEKIFQIPFQTRSMDQPTSQMFASALTEDIQTSDDGESEPFIQDETESNGLTSQFDDERGELSTIEHSESEHATFADLRNEGGTEVPGPWEESEAASDSVAAFAEIDMSTAEKTKLSTVAAIAGNTPRRLKRFVNTYLLAKSTYQKLDRAQWGEAWAPLMIQLAIAIRAPDKTSQVFFQICDRHSGSRGGIEKFLESFLGDSSLGPNESEIVDLITHELLACRNLEHLYDSEKREIRTQDPPSSASLKLVDDLKLMSKFARRYSFADPVASG